LEIASNIIIYAGIAFIVLGIIGIFRFRNFYARIIVAPLIDTVGAFTIIVGIAIRHGFGFFSLKLLILIILLMIINPLIAHIMARSAYLSGYKSLDENAGDDGDSV